MKILLLAYHVSPYRGSECSVAWNHICSMSKEHELTVLYGSSGDHLGDDNDLAKFHQSGGKLDNVTWDFISSNGFIELSNIMNRKGIFSYSFYIAYNLWHRKVFSHCRKNIDLGNYDVIHYLTPIGYREPGYLWKLNKPYVWGAVGGTTSIDFRLLTGLSLIGKTKLIFRRLVNTAQLKLSSRVSSAIKSTDVFISATSENRDNFIKYFNADSIYIPENGPIGDVCTNSDLVDKDSSLVNVVWIGSIEDRKNLRLLVDSTHYIHNMDKFFINIVGGGPLLDEMKNYVHKLGIDDRVKFHGSIPRSAVQEIVQLSDLHVITSVSEGNPTTIWEVMKYGIPTLTIDHCGMKDTISPDAGFKIPIDDYSKLVKSFANILNKIENDPDIIVSMRENVLRDFHNFHWDNRKNFFNDIYKKAVENYNKSTHI